jgi:hypothetical protein
MAFVGKWPGRKKIQRLSIDYRCEDRKKVGELRGDTGAN